MVNYGMNVFKNEDKSAQKDNCNATQKMLPGA